MARFAAVKVDKNLIIEVDSVDSGAGGNITVSAQLTRIAAQQLADALLEYSGVAHKSSDRGDRTRVPAYDRTVRPKAIPASPVIRLGTSKRKR